MRYFYCPPEKWKHENWTVYRCDHPMYNRCTLYLRGEYGLAVVQKRFNLDSKAFWWGSVDPPLAYDISIQPMFEEVFNECSGRSDQNGCYPTVPVRKLMWKLRMKPLKKETWEEDEF